MNNSTDNPDDHVDIEEPTTTTTPEEEVPEHEPDPTTPPKPGENDAAEGVAEAPSGSDTKKTDDSTHDTGKLAPRRPGITEMHPLMDYANVMVSFDSSAGVDATPTKSLADWAKSAPPGDTLTCSWLGETPAVPVLLKRLQGAVSVSRVGMKPVPRFILVEGAFHTLPYTGSGADNYVLDELGREIPDQRRFEQLKMNVLERGWSTMHGYGHSPRTKALLTLKVLAPDLVPLGEQDDQALFFCIADNNFKRVSLREFRNVGRLAALFGKDWTTVKNTLGIDDKGKYRRAILVSRLEEIFGLVASRRLEPAKIRDGVHLIDGQVFVVTSGGTFRRGPLMNWELLSPPIAGNTIAESTGLVTGAPQPTTTKDLEAAAMALYDGLGAWIFQAHEVYPVSGIGYTSTYAGEVFDWYRVYLTGWILAAPLMAMMPLEPPWLAIRAPSGAGKTQLQRFMGKVSGCMALCGRSTDHATMHKFGGSGVVMVMDDLEGTKRATQARDAILDALRNGAMSKGNLSARGYYELKLRISLILSGIYEPTLDQNRNRFAVVRLKKTPLHKEPLPTALAKVKGHIAAIRWGVLNEFSSYERAYERARGMCDHLEPRFARNVIPAAAALLLLGETDPGFTYHAEALIAHANIANPLASAKADDTIEHEFLEHLLDTAVEPDDQRDGAPVSLRRWIGRNLGAGDGSFKRLPEEFGAMHVDDEHVTLFLRSVAIQRKVRFAGISRKSDVVRLLEGTEPFMAKSQQVSGVPHMTQFRATVLRFPRSAFALTAPGPTR